METQKTEKTQHALVLSCTFVLVGLGSAALAAAVALPMEGSPNFAQRDNKV